MVRHSMVCQCLMQLWAMLAAAWPESGTYRVLCGLGVILHQIGALFRYHWPRSRFYQTLDRFGARVQRQAESSTVCRVLRRNDRLHAAWPASKTCNILNVVVNIPCALYRTAYQKSRKLLRGSMVFRVLSAAGSVPAAVVGVFLAIMLVVPHAAWNNLYALAGAILVTGIYAIGSATHMGHRLEAERLGPYFVLFLGMALFAFFTSLSWALSARFLGFYLTLFLLVLLTVSSIRKYEQLQLLVALAVAGVTVAAVYGCYQGITGVEVVESQQDMVLNAGMPGRVYSFFDNPNNFAEVLVMLMPLDFALILNARTGKGRAVALCSFVICAVALGVTYSRSSWLGCVLAAIVFLSLENWKLIPVMILVGLCCMPLLPDTIYRRILTIGNTSDTSTSYRFAIYKASWPLMKDYWIKGTGLGSDVLKEAFHDYPVMFDGNYPIHTHNNYLQVWAEMGVFGLIAFISTLFWRVKSGIRAYGACADKRLRRMLAAALSGFCGMLLISVAEYTWFYPRNMFFYWFLFGVIGACVKCVAIENRTAS